MVFKTESLTELKGKGPTQAAINTHITAATTVPTITPVWESAPPSPLLGFLCQVLIHDRQIVLEPLTSGWVIKRPLLLEKSRSVWVQRKT